MPETNAKATDAEIKLIRVDIENYLTKSRVLSEYSDAALSQFKIDLEDKRGFKFSQVFDETNDLYFKDTDDNTRNLDKIRGQMLPNLTISKVFRDYAIATSEETDSRWWDLANEYESRYDDRLKITQLDIDIDESGTIDETEERASAQKFFSK